MVCPRPTAGLTLALALAAVVVSAQQPVQPPLRPNFPVTLAGSGPVQVTQPAVGDLDNDGIKEIVVGTKGRQLWVLNADGTVRPGWPQTLPAEVVGSPAIGLIDGDSFPDIAVGFKGTTDPTGKGGIRAYRRDGSLIWSRLTATDERDDGVYSSPAIGNVDGLGGNEVVVGSFDFRVYVIQSDGSDLPGWPRKLRDTIYSSPALFDLDGDGKLEVIIGVDTHLEGPPYNTPDGGALYVFRYDGTVFPGFPRFIDQTMMSSPAVGDIDLDGKPEIVVGGGVFYGGNVGRKVYAFRCDGTYLPGWPVSVEGQVFDSPALGNIEGDARLEVVVTDENANVYAFRADGSLIFKTKPKSFFGTSSNADNPIIADVTGDGVPEILVATNTEIAVLTASGAQLTDDGSHDGRKSYYMDTAASGAVVTDLEMDGKIDIVAASGTPFPTPTSGKVYVWTPGPIGPAPWPAFRQDPTSRRGVVPGTPRCQAPAPQQFYTITPCRVVDTRNPNGPLGGPALAAMTKRDFPIRGNCGIPVTARSVALNVTVTGTTSFGDLRVYPSGAPPTTSSTINWSAGQTRANNTILELGASGSLTVWCVMFAGSTHLLFDVFGYFQ
ncbi:MAG TPA: VCBS repeat-containing protein [Thermoanaerobaculia bacterium]